MKGRIFGFHFFPASHSTKARINEKTEIYIYFLNNVREITERILEKELVLGNSQGLVLRILILLASDSLPVQISVNKLR